MKTESFFRLSTSTLAFGSRFQSAVLRIGLERSADEARLVQVGLGLLGVGEVPPGDGDVVGEEGAHGVGMLFQEFLAEEDVEELVVVAHRVGGGEELAQAAFRHLG